MFLFITTSDNFSPLHKAPMPRTHGKDGRHPIRGHLHPHGHREAAETLWTHPVSIVELLSGGAVEAAARPSMRSAVCDGALPPHRGHAHRRPCHLFQGNGNPGPGYRLPAWLRPGTKWPPGKKRLPLPHLVLGRLGGGHAVSCGGFHPLISAHGSASRRAARSDPRPPAAPWPPAAQPRFARLSTCGPAYRPGSRADFTPRVFGPLSGAFDCAWSVSIRQAQ